MDIIERAEQIQQRLDAAFLKVERAVGSGDATAGTSDLLCLLFEAMHCPINQQVAVKRWMMAHSDCPLNAEGGELIVNVARRWEKQTGVQMYDEAGNSRTQEQFFGEILEWLQKDHDQRHGITQPGAQEWKS